MHINFHAYYCIFCINHYILSAYYFAYLHIITFGYWHIVHNTFHVSRIFSYIMHLVMDFVLLIMINKKKWFSRLHSSKVYRLNTNTSLTHHFGAICSPCCWNHVACQWLTCFCTNMSPFCLLWIARTQWVCYSHQSSWSRFQHGGKQPKIWNQICRICRSTICRICNQLCRICKTIHSALPTSFNLLHASVNQDRSSCGLFVQ